MFARSNIKGLALACIAIGRGHESKSFYASSLSLRSRRKIFNH